MGAVAAANEIDDLHTIALPDERARERVPFENHKVVLDGNSTSVDSELLEQLGDRQRLVELVRFTVERDPQGRAEELYSRRVMRPVISPGVEVFDRRAALDRFRRTRARTRALFDLLDPSVYHEKPIALRNPIVFYEGHLPAFAVNTLIKKGLGRPGLDDHLETIFARGIDPEQEASAVARGNPTWPTRHV